MRTNLEPIESTFLRESVKQRIFLKKNEIFIIQAKETLSKLFVVFKSF
jgi:hypothetical protein